MSWWNTEPNSGEYGSHTILAPAWPCVDEELLSNAASRAAIHSANNSMVLAERQGPRSSIPTSLRCSNSNAFRTSVSTGFCIRWLSTLAST